jgi:hypothetical protein
MRMSGGDVDIDGLGLGQDGDGGGGGVDAPARFGFGDTLHPVHAAFVLEAGEDALARDARRDLLDAAELGLLPVDDLDLPALRLGVAGVHAQEVAREKRGLLAAGAGADLQHGGAGVGLVLRQERQLQRMFGLGDGGLRRSISSCARSRISGSSSASASVSSACKRAPFGDAGHDGLELGIFLGDRGDGVGRGARAELRLEKLETLGDLAQAVLWKHGRDVPGPSAAVKRLGSRGGWIKRRRASATRRSRPVVIAEAPSARRCRPRRIPLGVEADRHRVGKAHDAAARHVGHECPDPPDRRRSVRRGRPWRPHRGAARPPAGCRGSAARPAPREVVIRLSSGRGDGGGVHVPGLGRHGVRCGM